MKFWTSEHIFEFVVNHDWSLIYTRHMSSFQARLGDRRHSSIEQVSESG